MFGEPRRPSRAGPSPKAYGRTCCSFPPSENGKNRSAASDRRGASRDRSAPSILYRKNLMFRPGRSCSASTVRRGYQPRKGLHTIDNRPGASMKQLAVLVMLAIPLLAPSSAQAQRGGFGGGGMGGMGMGGSMPRFEPPELPGPELEGPPDTTAATKVLALKD